MACSKCSWSQPQAHVPLSSPSLPPPGVTGLLFPELVLGLSLLEERCMSVTICTHSIAALAKLLPLLDALNRFGSDALTRDRLELAWPGKPHGEPSCTHTQFPSCSAT